MRAGAAPFGVKPWPSLALASEPVEDLGTGQAGQHRAGRVSLDRRNPLPITTRGAAATAASTRTGQPDGSPMGVMPPYSIPVSATASSVAANDAFLTSSRRRARPFTSARVVASTTQAANRGLAVPFAGDDHAVGRIGGGDLVPLAERRRVGQFRVDLRHAHAVACGQPVQRRRDRRGEQVGPLRGGHGGQYSHAQLHPAQSNEAARPGCAAPAILRGMQQPSGVPQVIPGTGLPAAARRSAGCSRRWLLAR